MKFSLNALILPVLPLCSSGQLAYLCQVGTAKGGTLILKKRRRETIHAHVPDNWSALAFQVVRIVNNPEEAL